MSKTPILIDPDAVAFIQAVEKYNCRNTLEANMDRVQHFKRRIAELGKDPKDVVIVVLSVDDPHGGHIAEMLMPGQDALWAEIRARGEAPYARGLAGREGITEAVEILDAEVAVRLKAMNLAVVIMDRGVVEAFEA